MSKIRKLNKAISIGLLMSLPNMFTGGAFAYANAAKFPNPLTDPVAQVQSNQSIDQGFVSNVFLTKIMPEGKIRLSGNFDSLEDVVEDRRKVSLEAMDAAGNIIGLAEYILPVNSGEYLELSVNKLIFKSPNTAPEPFDYSKIDLIRAKLKGSTLYGSTLTRVGTSGDQVMEIMGVSVREGISNAVLSQYVKNSSMESAKANLSSGKSTNPSENPGQATIPNTRSPYNAGDLRAIARDAEAIESLQDTPLEDAKPIGNYSSLNNRGEIIDAYIGDRVQLAINYKAMASITSFEMDLVLPTGLKYIGIKPGEAALAAGKFAGGKIIEENKVHVLVSGLNQNILSEGPVAIVNAVVTPEARRGDQGFSLQNLILSDKNGTSMPHTTAVFSADTIKVHTANDPQLRREPDRKKYDGSSLESKTRGSAGRTSSGTSHGLDQVNNNMASGVESNIVSPDAASNPTPNTRLYFPKPTGSQQSEIGLGNPEKVPSLIILSGSDEIGKSSCATFLRQGEVYRRGFSEIFPGRNINFVDVEASSPILGFLTEYLKTSQKMNIVPDREDRGRHFFDDIIDMDNLYRLINPADSIIKLEVVATDRLDAELSSKIVFLNPQQATNVRLAELLETPEIINRMERLSIKSEDYGRSFLALVERPNTGLETLINIDPDLVQSIDTINDAENLQPCAQTSDILGSSIPARDLRNPNKGLLRKLEIGSRSQKPTMTLNGQYFADAQNWYKSTGTVSWTDNENPPATIFGYLVYNGPTSRNYDAALTLTLPGSGVRSAVMPIQRGPNFIAVTAKNTSEVESVYSDEAYVHGYGAMDLNNDLNANVLDLQILANVLMNLRACPGDCDVNRSGSLTVADYQSMISFLIGAIEAPWSIISQASPGSEILTPLTIARAGVSGYGKPPVDMSKKYSLIADKMLNNVAVYNKQTGAMMTIFKDRNELNDSRTFTVKYLSSI